MPLDVLRLAQRRSAMKFGLRYASLARYSNGPAAVDLAQAAEAAGRDPKAIEITVAAPANVEEIEALARKGIARVAVPISASAGLPARART
jgi:alkanesulfonate monooxygenase SsuD/methylene tetrahydromethanopterin reductase-like flavin-dependent oxidoreductase (luciferase family)